MIFHRPLGSGHRYLLDPDQRIPVQPVAGEQLELRATTDPSVTSLAVEVDTGGQIVRLDASPRPPEPTEIPPYAARRDGSHEGHLADAARASFGSQGDRRGWSVVLDPERSTGPLRYRFVAYGAEPTAWFAVEPAQWRPGRLAVDGPSDRLVPGSAELLAAGSRPVRLRFALRLRPGERVVGFGERFDALDQRGRALDCAVFEQYKAQGARTYLPLPFAFVVGESVWAFHVATSRRCWFDVGAADPESLTIEVELDGDEPPALELYAGRPQEILRRFLQRHGAPALPPDWVFQPWMSSNEWNSQARVLAEVERGEREGIPAGVVVIEAWSDEQTFVAFAGSRYEVHEDGTPHRFADFTFPDEGPWPDPKAMVDDLHRRGLRVVLWQIPLLKADRPPGTQAAADWSTMVARGYCVREEDGSPYRNRGWWFPRALLPDFTNAEAREWWLAKRRYLVEELGIDGFKTDGGEHAWGNELRYSDGTRGSETNNRYPVLYAAAYHALLDDCGREGVTFSRAGFTGASSYPCHWAGDEDSTWEAFRASLTAGLTAGASGIIFWGWDLAGFSGEIPSAELYLRSAAAACFAPIMQYHSEFNEHRRPSRDRTPWNVAERTGDARVLPISRRFALLRTRLVSYLAEQARLCVENGKPLMRAPFFEVPEDDRIWRFPFQYFLGDELLVAPVTAPEITELEVYVPAGDWVDAWSGDELTGPVLLRREVPLDEIPVYVRRAAAEELLPLFRAA